MTDLLHAAKALLNCIDNITTEDFARGWDRADREALRLAIAQAEMPVGTKIKLPDGEDIYEVDRVYLREADSYLIASFQDTPTARATLNLPFSAVTRT